MVKLESVSYRKENGKTIATEIYSDGSTRRVEIGKDGVVDYIINGSDKNKTTEDEK